MMSLVFEPIFQSPVALAFITIIVLAIPWLVPVAGGSVSIKQLRTLQILRTATALLLLLAVFRPSIVKTDSLPTQATLAVLIDRSRSMTLPADDKRKRFEVENGLYDQLAAAILEMDESLELKTLTYSSDVKTENFNDEFKQLLDAEPIGNATDIGGALLAASQSSSGKPLAGVVLMGDGVQVLPTKSSSTEPTTDPQSGARLFASLDVPLWPIAIGPPGDLDQVRDVELAELPESFSLFSGNETSIDFVVRTRALAGKELVVRILLASEDGSSPSSEIATRLLTPTEASAADPLSIPIAIAAAGSYRLEVRVDAQEGESLLTNNSQIAFVDVREGGGRVLYLEGQPRAEQAFLLRALRRFPDLEVTYRWIASDTKSRWPIDLLDSKGSVNADVVIIGDLPAAAIGNDQLTKIAQHVSKGGALLVIGGMEAFAQGGYDASPLADVLPVKLDKSKSELEGEIKIVPVGSHPVTNLESGENGESQSKIWGELPALVGASRFVDAKVAPGVEILLETQDEEPLLVIGEFGGGRVAAFAGDSTWRWWRRGKSVEHRRFWRQLLLWLLDRKTDAADGVEVVLDKRRIEAGQSIGYQVLSTLKSDLPLSLAVVAADGTETKVSPNLTSTDDGEQKLEGELKELPSGVFRFKASFGDDAAASSVEKSFQVLDQDAELRQPFADHAYLAQLASQTSDAGGAMFQPNEIGNLIDLIKQLRRTSLSPVVKKYRLGDTGVSAWPLFITLASLLSVEWFLRRRWGLA